MSGAIVTRRRSNMYRIRPHQQRSDLQETASGQTTSLYHIPCERAVCMFTGARCRRAGSSDRLALTRVNADELRAWDSQIDLMIRNRDLRVREVQADGIISGRQHQRLDQYYRFVPIVGSDITRQLARDGTVSIFGTLHTGIELNTTPALSVDDAEDAIRRSVNGRPREGSIPELVVLPLADGYHLAYFGQATTDVEVLNIFVDATNGVLLRQFSDFASDVGLGKGTYGDNKKISTTAAAGTFVADDKLRPAAITTYDMKGDLVRTQAVLNNLPPSTSDVASSTNNNEWTDGTVVDAHVYAGMYYDTCSSDLGATALTTATFACRF